MSNFWKNIVSFQYLLLIPVVAPILEFNFAGQNWVQVLGLFLMLMIAIFILLHNQRSTGYLRLLPLWKWLALINTFCSYLLLVVLTAGIDASVRNAILCLAFPLVFCFAWMQFHADNGELHSTFGEKLESKN